MHELIYEPFDVKDFDDSIRTTIWQKEMGNIVVDKYIRGDITKNEFEQLLEYNPNDSKTNIDFLSITKDLPDDILKELNWGV